MKQGYTQAKIYNFNQGQSKIILLFQFDEIESTNFTKSKESLLKK